MVADTSQQKDDILRKRSNIIIFSIFILAISCQFASDNYLPSLPAITHYFNTSIALSQLTITAYLMGLSCSQFFYGILSDRFGRRGPLIMGLVVFFVGSLICTFANSIHILVAGRIIQGIGLGANIALLRPILCDSFSGEKLAQVGSYLGAILSITPALAPVTGGYIQTHFGWRANFAVLMIMAIVIFTLIFKYLPETISKRNMDALKSTALKKNFVALVSSRNFIGYALAAGLTYSGIIAYAEISPYLLQKTLQLSPITYGWLAIFTTAALAVGAYTNGRLVKKFKIQPMLRLGMGLMLLSGIMMLTINSLGVLNIATILVPTMVFFLGTGFVISNSFAAAFKPFAHIAGFAGAVYGTLQMFMAFTTSALVALIPNFSQLDLAGILTGLAVVIVCIWLVVITHEKPAS